MKKRVKKELLNNCLIFAVFVLVSGFLLISSMNFVSAKYTGKSDIAVYYPYTKNATEPNWFILMSHDGFKTFPFGYAQTAATSFLTGDDILGDFDADGKTDLTLFCRNNCGSDFPATWYILRSKQGFYKLTFGWQDSAPISGDFNGDGANDIAVYYNGYWYFYMTNKTTKTLENGTYYNDNKNFTFGWDAVKPYPGDFDADGKTDVAVYYPLNGTWFILNNITGTTKFWTMAFGYANARPVVADYDGDGKDDLAVYDTFVGKWYFRLSNNTNYTVVTNISFGWNNPDNYPAVADFDDDRKADITIFCRENCAGNPDATWFILRSKDGFMNVSFGWKDVFPVPGNYDGDYCTRNLSTYWDGSSCIGGKIANCMGGLPINAVWNDAGANGTFTQRYVNFAWTPQTKNTMYNLTVGDCNFRCRNSSYFYNSTSNQCSLIVIPSGGNKQYCSDFKNRTSCESVAWNSSIVRNSVLNISLCNLPAKSSVSGSMNCMDYTSCLCTWQNDSCTSGLITTKNCTGLPNIVIPTDPDCFWTYTIEDNCAKDNTKFLKATPTDVSGSGCLEEKQPMSCVSTAELDFTSNLSLIVIILLIIFIYLYLLRKRRLGIRKTKNQKK
jgi:hypothetical protein